MGNKDVHISWAALSLGVRMLYSIGTALVLFDGLALHFLLLRCMIVGLEVLHDIGVGGMLLTG